ncbi:hypothetical protein FFLO_05517 [Filobasidium floriforme]|uniref:Uncharacterized protein n=1 Tax=Filobasidium floriforme TaxID=5210 RepID=A0A8K0JM87_9TREE|nr:hypothetical protein FFLO_05517 [Filobasidium floriforme]
MHLSQAVLAVVLAASSVQAAAINPRDLAERDPLFSSILSWKGNYEQDWNSLYFLAGKQNVYDLCCSIKPKTVTQYQHQTVTDSSIVKATATVEATEVQHAQKTITEHVPVTSVVATEHAVETAYVTASPDYHHKRTFNWLWNDFFQKLYAKDAALTEIKCAALGYKVPVKTVNIPVTETVKEFKTQTVATQTKTGTKTEYATVTTKVTEIVPVTETKKSTVTVTIQPTTAAAPTQTPIKDSYPVCSGSTGSGVSWAHYAGVSYSLDSFYSFGCDSMQTCTNECKDSWSKHGKDCAGIQWNPLSKQCSLKGEASTAAKFNFDFNFSSSVFLIKNKDCQSNSLWAPSKGNDCCCNYKA